MITITEKEIKGVGRARTVAKQDGPYYGQYSYMINNIAEEDKVELDKFAEIEIDKFIAKKKGNA